MSEMITVSCETVRPLTLLAGEHRLQLTRQADVIELGLSIPPAPWRGLAVVCHPHPLMGGTMDNKVITTVARCFRDQGLVVIRLNFRGVGASTGLFDHGIGEQDDVLAVARWAQEQFRLPWRLLAGFSFGAYVALRVHHQLSSNSVPLPRLALIAPPVTRFELPAASLADGTEVIYGDADEVVDPSAIAQWLALVPRTTRICKLEGAGHFFHGRLGDLKQWAQQVCADELNTRSELG